MPMKISFSVAKLMVIGLATLTLVTLLVIGLMGLNPPAKSSPASTGLKAIATAAPVGIGSSADTRIVLVSGRDDHGLLEEAHVPLYQAPSSSQQVAMLDDGVFARVLEVRGNWLRIQSLTPAQESGWIDDFYLRGKALRKDGGGQVQFAAARLVNGEVYVAVYPIGNKTAEVSWLPQASLKEIGADNSSQPHSH